MQYWCNNYRYWVEYSVGDGEGYIFGDGEGAGYCLYRTGDGVSLHPAMLVTGVMLEEVVLNAVLV